MVRFISTVLAAALFLFSTSTAQDEIAKPASTVAFLSDDGYFFFALNVPEDEGSDELYFTMQGTDASWIAVGLGNDQMANSLIFMAHADASGKGITLSPRLSYGNTEPAYTSNIKVEVLPGSTITDSHIKVNAKCKNCRSWKGGSIKATDSPASFIFASGPGDWIKSNSKSAGVKRHSSYGSFVMDVTKAVGVASIPDAGVKNSTVGTIQTNLTFDTRNFAGAAHAALMVLTFFGLLPSGIVILRVFKSPKWHGAAQGLSMALAMAGVVIGIMMGMKYNRTKNFNSPHQIIGLIVIVGLIGQFVLGFMHHRIYTKTQAPTKLAPIHVWLGRFVILLGIINGFVGFPLALNPKYDLALLSILLFVLIVFGPLAFWRYRRNLKQKNGGSAVEDEGYNAQPWVTAGQSRSDVNLGHMQPPPVYQNQPAQQGRQFV